MTQLAFLIVFSQSSTAGICLFPLLGQIVVRLTPAQANTTLTRMATQVYQSRDDHPEGSSRQRLCTTLTLVHDHKPSLCATTTRRPCYTAEHIDAAGVVMRALRRRSGCRLQRPWTALKAHLKLVGNTG
jgi:hypothetical protein